LSANDRSRRLDLRCPICRAEPEQTWQSVGEILRELPTKAAIIGTHGNAEVSGVCHMLGYVRCGCEEDGCPHGSVMMVPFVPTAKRVNVSAFMVDGTTPTFEAAPSKSKVRRLKKRRARERPELAQKVGQVGLGGHGGNHESLIPKANGSESFSDSLHASRVEGVTS